MLKRKNNDVPDTSEKKSKKVKIDAPPTPPVRRSLRTSASFFPSPLPAPVTTNTAPTNIVDPEPSNPLDLLAWLLQVNTSDCTAATIVNGHILVATNGIGPTVKVNKNKTLSYIHTVLTALSRMSSGTLSTAETKKLVTTICETKLQGENKGFITCPMQQKELAALIALFPEAYSSGQAADIEPETSLDKELKKWKHSTSSIAAGLAVGNKILRRLWRLQNLLTSGDSDLKTALQNIGSHTEKAQHFLRLSDQNTVKYEDYKWLSDTAPKGYAIIATHLKQAEQTVHAELKILDYLIAARIISSLQDMKIYYLGTSIRCCKTCGTAIDSVNKAIEKKNILADRSHLVSTPLWSRPKFLLSPEASTDDTSKRILDQAKKYKCAGYFYVKQNNTVELIALQNLTEYATEKEKIKNKKGQTVETYLHRDYHLAKKIREIFEKKKTELDVYVNSDSDPERHMSHSSPEKPKPITKEKNIQKKLFFAKKQTAVSIENSDVQTEFEVMPKFKTLHEKKRWLEKELEEVAKNINDSESEKNSSSTPI